MSVEPISRKYLVVHKSSQDQVISVFQRDEDTVTNLLSRVDVSLGDTFDFYTGKTGTSGHVFLAKSLRVEQPPTPPKFIAVIA